MYKLLIVDDEPLVQVGIKSMVNWQELNIEIVGTAMNGQIALDLMEKYNPDIVITDIKMPVMDGLELLRKSDARYGTERPEFIMLTSYEDFRLAKEAIKYRAFDYLLKVELTPDSLKETMQKVTAHLEEDHGHGRFPQNSQEGLHAYTEKFMISLLNNLFESEEQMRLEAEDLNINLNCAEFLSCYGSLQSGSGEDLSSERALSLYQSALAMVTELTEKYTPCYTLSLDITHFALILNFTEKKDFTTDDYEKICGMFEKIANSLKNYINVSLRIGIGFAVGSPLGICESYQYSRLSYRQTDDETSVFYQIPEADMPHDAFHFALFRKDLTKAFEEYNSDLLTDTIHSLSDLLAAHPHHYVQALDAASNILYLAISLLPEGNVTMAEFFKESPGGYMSLYRQLTVDQVVAWLDYLCCSLCTFFDEKKKDYKNRTVADVKTYIAEHVRDRLSLNEVAARFGISPSYLSQLFSKYNDTGFSEYINICKVEAAKKMLKEENSKVYEVADALSFGSEFYFSKVFKKVEGITPTEYINGVY